jgi:hypothetical protein
MYRCCRGAWGIRSGSVIDPRRAGPQRKAGVKPLATVVVAQEDACDGSIDGSDGEFEFFWHLHVFHSASLLPFFFYLRFRCSKDTSGRSV